MTVKDFIAKYKPCSDAVTWLEEFTTMSDAWEACRRSDWMLWSLGKSDYNDEKKLRAYACYCVRHTPLGDGRVVWDLLTDERSRNAIEVAERYIEGKATQEELAAAGSAARSAAWSVWCAAGYAGSAVGSAAQSDFMRKIIGNPFKIVEVKE